MENYVRSNCYIRGMSYNLPHPLRGEAEKALELFESTYKDDQEVIRWKVNSEVPNRDMLEFWEWAGKKFDMQKAIEARNEENEEFIRRYKENIKEPSDEELCEMR